MFSRFFWGGEWPLPSSLLRLCTWTTTSSNLFLQLPIIGYLQQSTCLLFTTKQRNALFGLLYRRPLMPREISHVSTGAINHPPKADNRRMLDHLITSMYTVSRQHTQTGIIMLGDFNQLPDGQLRSYPLKQVVTSTSRKRSILDKIYTNIGVTKSDHDAVLIAPSACPQRP